MNVLADLKHGFRVLLRTPLFTICTIAALAIGIGSTTALFSVVHTLLMGRRTEKAPLVWADSLGMPADGFTTTIWDRLGLWWAIAGVLVIVAYAIPLYDILTHARYGSPGFKPF